jgi:hypothetical protein
MSAASTPPPSATIETFEPSLAGAGVAALPGVGEDARHPVARVDGVVSAGCDICVARAAFLPAEILIRFRRAGGWSCSPPVA